MLQELIFEVYYGAILGLGILGLICIIYWKSPQKPSETTQENRNLMGLCEQTGCR